MEHVGQSMIHCLLKQEGDYLLTVLTGTGAVEFLFHGHRFFLMTPGTEETWPAFVDAEHAEYLVRPADPIPVDEAAPLEWAEVTTPEEGEEVAFRDGRKRKRATVEFDQLKHLQPLVHSTPGADGGGSRLEIADRKLQARQTMALGDDPFGRRRNQKLATVEEQREFLREEVVEEVAVINIDPSSTSPVWVGRMDGCDTVIEDMSISRWHCQLLPRNGAILLRDNQSTNGCFVGGEAVSESVVAPGELFYLGRVLCTLRLNGKGPR